MASKFFLQYSNSNWSCVPSLSLWRGELSWTEAWWNEPQIKPFFWEAISHSSETREASHLPVRVCVTDLSVAAPICVSVCVGDTKRQNVCVCVAQCFPSSLTQYTPLFYRSGPSLSPSVSLSILPFIPFYWSQILICPFVWCPLEKEDVMGDRAFLTQQMAFFKAPSGSSH